MWFEVALANGYKYNCYTQNHCYQDNGSTLELGDEKLHTTSKREIRMRYWNLDPKRISQEKEEWKTC